MSRRSEVKASRVPPLLVAGRSGRKRASAISKLGANAGWTFVTGSDKLGPLVNFELLSGATGVANVLGGAHEGVEFRFFDVALPHQVSKRKTDLRVRSGISTRLAADAARLHCKPIVAKNQMKAGLGWVDLRYGSDEFDNRFHTTCEDREAALAFLVPAVQAAMLAFGEGWAFEAYDSALLALRVPGPKGDPDKDNSLVAPDQIGNLTAQLSRLAAAVPVESLFAPAPEAPASAAGLFVDLPPARW